MLVNHVSPEQIHDLLTCFLFIKLVYRERRVVHLWIWRSTFIFSYFVIRNAWNLIAFLGWSQLKRSRVDAWTHNSLSVTTFVTQLAEHRTLALRGRKLDCISPKDLELHFSQLVFVRYWKTSTLVKKNCITAQIN